MRGAEIIDRHPTNIISGYNNWAFTAMLILMLKYLLSSAMPWIKSYLKIE